MAVLNKEGVQLQTIGETTSGRGNNQFNHPRSVAVEPGLDGRIYVADGFNHRVQVFSKEVVYVRTIGRGHVNRLMHRFHVRNPWGVCIDQGPDGCVYVADKGNMRVLVFLKAEKRGG